MIRVYYRVGSTKTFPNANAWSVDEKGNVSIIREEEGEDAAMIAWVSSDTVETVVDVDLQDYPFPHPPMPYEAGVVIP